MERFSRVPRRLVSPFSLSWSVPHVGAIPVSEVLGTWDLPCRTDVPCHTADLSVPSSNCLMSMNNY